MGSSLPPGNRQIRVIGFDDAPHARTDVKVSVTGIVCANCRFEGLVWGEATKDGWDATDAVAGLLGGSKYAAQVHAVLIDGIAFGGLNVVDLQALHARVGVPCLSVMRRHPDLAGMDLVIDALPDPPRRRELIARAGPIHAREPFVFQVVGATVDDGEAILRRTTDTGKVPEPLRLAHLIASGVIDGQSRGRA